MQQASLTSIQKSRTIKGMDAFAAHKKEVERMIVETIITALEQQTVSADEFSAVSAYILEHSQTVTTQEQLIAFLRTLSAKWSIFTPILVLESGELKEKVEDDALEGVLELAKDGKIEEALSMAKSVTET